MQNILQERKIQNYVPLKVKGLLQDRQDEGLEVGCKHFLTAVKSLYSGCLEYLDTWIEPFNPLNPELNPICYLLALLGAHHFLHVSRMRVKLLTFSLLMSYIYMEHPFLMFLVHTRRRSTVGRTPLDE